jgi:hypothetical protein
MIFISLEPFHKIKQFGDSIGLTHLPNVLLGKIDEQTADEILGITSAPQLFIYNKEGQLTKQFKGSTRIEAIIKYAKPGIKWLLFFLICFLLTVIIMGQWH